MKIIKARLDLVPPETIYALAEAFEDGATKYGAHNWEEDYTAWDAKERLAAAMRHILEYSRGIQSAEDSGIVHLHHALADISMVATKDVRTSINRIEKFTPGMNFDIQSIPGYNEAQALLQQQSSDNYEYVDLHANSPTK